MRKNWLRYIYINWGCYTYGKDAFEVRAEDEFKLGLRNVGLLLDITTPMNGIYWMTIVPTLFKVVWR